MFKFAKIALPLSIAFAAIAPQVASAEEAVFDRPAAVNIADFQGKMLYGPNGERIAAIYKVTADGNAQILLNGKAIVVPASSLSAVDGKLVTSLGKRDLVRSGR